MVSGQFDDLFENIRNVVTTLIHFIHTFFGHLKILVILKFILHFLLIFFIFCTLNDFNYSFRVSKVLLWKYEYIIVIG